MKRLIQTRQVSINHHGNRGSHASARHMYKYFNVTCFTSNPQSLVKNTLARFVNCLIKSLNDKSKLPRIILVIPDADLMKFIKKSADHDYENMQMFIEGALNWVMNQMTRAVDAKKDNLHRRKL